MLHSEYMSENVTEELEEIEVGTTHRGLSCTLTPTYTGAPVTATVKSSSVYPYIKSQAVTSKMNEWVLYVGTVNVYASGWSNLSRLRMDIDLTPIEDSLGYNPRRVTLSVDDHGVDVNVPYEVVGTLDGTTLTFDFPLYGQVHGPVWIPLDFGVGFVCDACHKRTVEYANPMRMVLTQ